MEYKINIDQDKYYKAALKVVNCFLELTDYELELIAQMLNYKIKTLTLETRKQLIDILSTSTHTFNNYIKKLKDKKVLIDTNYGLAIHPSITNSLEDREIKIKFNVNTTTNI